MPAAGNAQARRRRRLPGSSWPQQLSKQLARPSAMPQDDSLVLRRIAPYQDQFAEILAKAVTDGTAK